MPERGWKMPRMLDVEVGNLVLTRKPGESILIGEFVEVIFEECRTGRTKVSIRAPKNVRVIRSELDRR